MKMVFKVAENRVINRTPQLPINKDHIYKLWLRYNKKPEKLLNFLLLSTQRKNEEAYLKTSFRKEHQILQRQERNLISDFGIVASSASAFDCLFHLIFPFIVIFSV